MRHLPSLFLILLLVPSVFAIQKVWITSSAHTSGSNQSIQVVDVLVKQRAGGVVDITAPALQLFSPSGTFYRQTNLPLNFSATDAFLNVCWYYITTSAGTVAKANTTISCLVNTTFDLLQYNSFTLSFFVNDTAGNRNSSSINFTLGVPEETGGEQGIPGPSGNYSGVVGGIIFYNYSIKGNFINFSYSFYDTYNNTVRAPPHNISFLPNVDLTYLGSMEEGFGKYTISFLIGDVKLDNYTLTINSATISGNQVFEVGKPPFVWKNFKFKPSDLLTIPFMLILVFVLSKTPLGRKTEEEAWFGERADVVSDAVDEIAKQLRSKVSFFIIGIVFFIIGFALLIPNLSLLPQSFIATFLIAGIILILWSVIKK